MKAFHARAPCLRLRFGAGGQQRASAVSIDSETLLRHALATVLGEIGHQFRHALEVDGVVDELPSWREETRPERASSLNETTASPVDSRAFRRFGRPGRLRALPPPVNEKLKAASPG